MLTVRLADGLRHRLVPIFPKGLKSTAFSQKTGIMEGERLRLPHLQWGWRNKVLSLPSAPRPIVRGEDSPWGQH